MPTNGKSPGRLGADLKASWQIAPYREGLRKRRMAARTRHRRHVFIETYLQSLDPERAAKAAGYRVRGSTLLHVPAIRAAIEARLEALAVTPAWIEARLHHLSLREGEGSSHSAQVQATLALAKIRGMLVERSATLGKHEVTVRFEHEGAQGSGQ